MCLPRRELKFREENQGVNDRSTPADSHSHVELGFLYGNNVRSLLTERNPSIRSRADTF